MWFNKEMYVYCSDLIKKVFGHFCNNLVNTFLWIFKQCFGKENVMDILQWFSKAIIMNISAAI